MQRCVRIFSRAEPILQQSSRAFSGQEMAYSERRLIGFSRDEMFDIVADVEQYSKFVPWCRRSEVQQEYNNAKIAELEIGFRFLNEKYTSRVTHVHPSVVHSECTDVRIFETLDTIWRFGKGKDGVARSCTLYFDLTFEFRSSLYRQVTHVFFDQVVKTMVGAFLKRAEEKYGAPSFPSAGPIILQYKN